MEKKFQEPLMVTCTLPSPTDNVKHKISCINLHSNVKISKCMLGFESESRLFKSQRLQAALAYCHKNVESWYREVRLAPNLDEESSKHFNAINQEETVNKKNDNVEEEIIVNNESNCASSKQLITKEVIDKFHKPKKWYKHFKILGSNTEVKQTDPIDGSEKVRSIDRYKDMSKLIEEKFGKKSYNPVKKSASFMFSTKRIDLDETKNQSKNTAALLKCQSLDTPLYSIEDRLTRKTDEPSKDFVYQKPKTESKNFLKREPQSLRETKPFSLQITEINFDEIKSIDETKLKKSKPDLIPTLTKDNSFITDRLCSEFHVKTKLQQKRINDKLRRSYRDESALNFSLINPSESKEESPKRTSIVVQVHEISTPTKTKQPLDEDIPYSQVADEIKHKTTRKTSDENIYAEICENSCTNCINNKNCDCKRTTNVTTKSEYCYVKLGSNGESITSDSDEAIYNTLR